MSEQEEPKIRRRGDSPRYGRTPKSTSLKGGPISSVEAARIIAKTIGFTEAEIRLMMDCYVALMISELTHGREFVIPMFGLFIPRARFNKVYIDRKSGKAEKVILPVSITTTFRASPALRNRLREKSREYGPKALEIAKDVKELC